jgi:ATP-dependent Clp protease ATP-binding subunit ClpC
MQHLFQCFYDIHLMRDRYEAHHRINISDEALEAAAKLSNRYVSDRFLPI